MDTVNTKFFNLWSADYEANSVTMLLKTVSLVTIIML